MTSSQIPYWGTKNIRGHNRKFILPDDLAPRLCAPLVEMLVTGEGLLVRFCEHGDGHWYWFQNLFSVWVTFRYPRKTCIWQVVFPSEKAIFAPTNVNLKKKKNSCVCSLVWIYRLASIWHLLPKLSDVGQHGNSTRREGEQGKSMTRGRMYCIWGAALVAALR